MRFPAPATDTRSFRPIFAHSARRNIEADLQRQFIGDALFSPRHVLFDQALDELANVLGKRWPAALRLPTPVQLEPFAMPANERACLNHRERRFPVEETRPKKEGQAGSIGQSPWSDLVFLVVGELFSQEQDLSR